MFSVVPFRQIQTASYNTFIFYICYQDQLTLLGLQFRLAWQLIHLLLIKFFAMTSSMMWIGGKNCLYYITLLPGQLLLLLFVFVFVFCQWLYCFTFLTQLVNIWLSEASYHSEADLLSLQPSKLISNNFTITESVWNVWVFRNITVLCNVPKFGSYSQ